MLSLKESLKYYTSARLRKEISNYNKSVKISGFSKLDRYDLEKLILLNQSKFQHLILEKPLESKKETITETNRKMREQTKKEEKLKKLEEEKLKKEREEEEERKEKPRDINTEVIELIKKELTTTIKDKNEIKNILEKIYPFFNNNKAYGKYKPLIQYVDIDKPNISLMEFKAKTPKEEIIKEFVKFIKKDKTKNIVIRYPAYATRKNTILIKYLMPEYLEYEKKNY